MHWARMPYGARTVACACVVRSGDLVDSYRYLDLDVHPSERFHGLLAVSAWWSEQCQWQGAAKTIASSGSSQSQRNLPTL